MRPYLRAANVTWSGLDLSDVNSMNFTDDEMQTYRLEPGDLLLNEASGSAGEVGKPALWTGEIADCAFQNTLIRVRPTRHEPKFLLHFLRWQALAGRFVQQSRGVGIHHLTRARLAAWPTPLPRIEEQRRIVDILEDHLSRLDAGIAGLKHSHGQTRLLIASVLAQETACSQSTRLCELAVSSGYGTSTKCVVDGPGMPVARIPNVIAGHIDMSDEKRVADAAVDVSGYMLAEGDLLVVRTNGSRDLIGRSAVVQAGVQAAFASYLIRYQLDARRVLPGWVNAVLASPAKRVEIERLAASSAGQYNLSLAKLDSIAIPVPSLADQSRALATVDGYASLADRLVGEIDIAARRAAHLRRALLSAAFSGRLTGGSSDIEQVEESMV